MKIAIKKTPAKPAGFQLPTDRREPSADMWQYAYSFTGVKKIGKTTLAVHGAEEFVIQFDKPQIAYSIREECPRSWGDFMEILKALEARAKSGDFPYNRIVIDGEGEWYQMCHVAACKEFGVDHPSEVGYAKCWHKIRDTFTDAVNRLMRLQITARCGIVFIAHAEWKEVKTRTGVTVEKMVPAVPGKCEEIVGGKVDGWFVYDYIGSHRVMFILGDETMVAGHRIGGRFMTKDGRRVREIVMGESEEDAMAAFIAAFNNQQEYATFKEWEQKNSAPKAGRGLKIRRS